MQSTRCRDTVSEGGRDLVRGVGPAHSGGVQTGYRGGQLDVHRDPAVVVELHECRDWFVLRVGAHGDEDSVDRNRLHHRVLVL